MMDNVGNKAARQEIAMIKVVAPNMAQKIVDWAIQVFGGGGTSNDHFLAAALATTRRCASPTGRTKCIAIRSASWSCGAISTPIPRGAAAAENRYRSRIPRPGARAGYGRVLATCRDRRGRLGRPNN